MRGLLGGLLLSLCMGPLVWAATAPNAYWPMNDSTGPLMVNTSPLGAGLNGTLCQGTTCPQQGPSWVSGQLGGALQCDGVDDNVEVPSSAALNMTGDLTIAFWIRLISTINLSVDAPILQKEDPINGPTPWWVALTTPATPRLNWYHYSDVTGAGDAFLAFTGYTLPTATWVHIALVRTVSTKTVRLHVNGAPTPIQSLTWTTDAPQASTVPARFCANASRTSTHYANIALDDVQMIPAALSGNEIAALAETSAYLTFAWDAPVDPTGITGYRIYYRIAPAAYTSFVDVGNVLTGSVTGLTPNTLYYFAAVAYDIADQLSPFSQEVGNITGPTTPTTPTFLRLGAMACREVRLRWNPSFDNLAVTEYRLRRNGAQIGTTAGAIRSYDDAVVNPSTAYTYVVRAADASANESSDSNSLVLTTPACP
jgi:hypothetical protein